MCVVWQVTGDGTTKAGPRHRNKVCPDCLRQWATGFIREGRLFVRCPVPDCGRSLQTLELKTLVAPCDYNALVERIKDAEALVEHTLDEAVAGLELRLCPQCSVRMEKNEGCMQMVCYRCGHSFPWASAELVKPPKNKPAAAASAATAAAAAAAATTANATAAASAAEPLFVAGVLVAAAAAAAAPTPPHGDDSADDAAGGVGAVAALAAASGSAAAAATEAAPAFPLYSSLDQGGKVAWRRYLNLCQVKQGAAVLFPQRGHAGQH